MAPQISTEEYLEVSGTTEYGNPWFDAFAVDDLDRAMVRAGADGVVSRVTKVIVVVKQPLNKIGDE